MKTCEISLRSSIATLAKAVMVSERILENSPHLQERNPSKRLQRTEISAAFIENLLNDDMGVGVAIGLAIGAALGVALKNIPMWTGLGVVIGVAIGFAIAKS